MTKLKKLNFVGRWTVVVAQLQSVCLVIKRLRVRIPTGADLLLLSVFLHLNLSVFIPYYLFLPDLDHIVCDSTEFKLFEHNFFKL